MKKYSAILMLPLITLFLAACSTDGSERMKYYRLGVFPSDTTSAIDSRIKTRIVIDQIQLPRFLRQESMVIQLDGNEIYTANYHRWAEPLDEAISKLLVVQLNSRDERFRYEASAGAWNKGANIHLRIEFNEFHSKFSKEVVVSGRLWIYNQNKELKFEELFHFSEPLSQEGYDHSVKALQLSTSRLSDRIVEAARSIDWASI